VQHGAVEEKNESGAPDVRQSSVERGKGEGRREGVPSGVGKEETQYLGVIGGKMLDLGRGDEGGNVLRLARKINKKKDGRRPDKRGHP